MTGDINIFWLLCIALPIFLFGVALGRAIEIRELWRFHESLRLSEGGQNCADHDQDPRGKRDNYAKRSRAQI